MALGKSAKYYRKNPEAYKKKLKYDTAHHAQPHEKKKRAETNTIRRRAKAAGKNVKGKDYDHATKRFVKSSVNRGRKGGTKGDKNARGGK